MDWADHEVKNWDSDVKDAQKAGFTFVGPTICYAFMQSVGMADDHVVGCFKYRGMLA
jgi:DNA-3-methyladenine glycosylase I